MGVIVGVCCYKINRDWILCECVKIFFSNSVFSIVTCKLVLNKSFSNCKCQIGYKTSVMVTVIILWLFWLLFHFNHVYHYTFMCCGVIIICWVTRTIREAIWIRCKSPNVMNRDEGTRYLSHVYDPLSVDLKQRPLHSSSEQKRSFWGSVSSGFVQWNCYLNP